MTYPDAHALTGAYALDALDARDRAGVEAHLAVCATCAVEVRELRAVADLLGGAVPHTPPPALRASVLREISQTPQLPPVAQARGQRPPRRLRVAAIAAGITVAVLGGLGAVSGLAVHQRHALAEARAQVANLDRIAQAAAPPGRPLTGGGQLSVISAGDRVYVDLRDLPGLDPGRVYQLWMAGARGVRSAGTIPGTAGHATRLVPLGTGTTSVKITVEPEGGSPQPTTPELVDVPVGR